MMAVSIGTAPQPDGSHVVVMKIETPMAEFLLALPIEAAETLADQLPAELRKNAAEARRLGTGLVISSTLPKHPLGGIT